LLTGFAQGYYSVLDKKGFKCYTCVIIYNNQSQKGVKMKEREMNKKEKKRFLAGLVCGEGCFSHYNVTKKSSVGDEYSYPEWRFVVDMHIRDLCLLEMLREEIGIGKVRRNIHKGSEKNNICRYEICSKKQNYKIIIPYFNNILYGYKLSQFKEWRDGLIQYCKGNKKRKIAGGKKAWKTTQQKSLNTVNI
jgi:hypothetical protein